MNVKRFFTAKIVPPDYIAIGCPAYGPAEPLSLYAELENGRVYYVGTIDYVEEKEEANERL